MSEPVDVRAERLHVLRRRLRLVLRIAVTAVALGWTLSRVDLGEVGAAAARIAPAAAAGAIALTLANLVLGAARWRLLLGAYDAQRRPSILRLTHIYCVGLFYNTFLPANVGGDVVRGFVLRDAFPSATTSYLVVLIERLFGLAGLLLLSASILLIHPVIEVRGLPALAALGLLGAAAAATLPVLAGRIGARVPGRIGRLLRRLPSAVQPMQLVGVLGLSVCIQATVAAVGYLLLGSVADVSPAQALVLVPVALAAMYLPTIAGLGAREAAFVLLFGMVGVSEADAAAGSLALFAVQLLVALAGGVVHLAAPIGDKS